MIMVDIYVPGLDRIYDFYLDAHQTVGQLTVEISKLIAIYEEIDLYGEEKEFLLCEMEKGVVLHAQYSLAEQGVEDGAGLLLV